MNKQFFSMQLVTLNFKRCQSTSGIEKMKQAIQVFDILGEDKLKLHYTDHFNKLVNKK